MSRFSGFFVVVICCAALLLSITGVAHSQLPFLPPNQQLSNNSQARPSPVIEPSACATNVPKVAILTFGDGWKSQFTNAKPILEIEHN